MMPRDAFDIFVVDDGGKGLQGVRVTVVFLDGLLSPLPGGEWHLGYHKIQGITDANGWCGFTCRSGIRGEIFLDNKSYGNYWCENGASVTIRK